MMSRWVFLSLVAWVFSLPVHAEVAAVDSAQLARLLAAGVPIIDIRTEGEWRESGVVPGSKLLTFFDERGRSDPPAWLQKVQEVAKPGQPVIVICRSGNRTRAASQFLSEQAGYQKVYHVQGGILAWEKEGRPLTPLTSAMAKCPAGTSC
jgi:rhodanese-related sulfurtransferase